MKWNENDAIIIDPGDYNGFLSLDKLSKILVFSNQTLKNLQDDDFRITLEVFSC